MKPTKEQIDAARSILLNVRHGISIAEALGQDVFESVAVLLAATATPTDEELAAEAARFATAIVDEGGGAARALEALAGPPPVATWERLAVAYFAGARRESRR